MKKLTLDLDVLSVQSFETGRVAAELRGTVRAREEVAPPSWLDPTPCSICATVCKPTLENPA